MILEGKGGGLAPPNNFISFFFPSEKDAKSLFCRLLPGFSPPNMKIVATGL